MKTQKVNSPRRGGGSGKCQWHTARLLYRHQARVKLALIFLAFTLGWALAAALGAPL